MAYTSGIYFIDLESGSDAARTALTSVTASNPSGTITRLNKTAHGLVTGAVVDTTLFTTWLNSAWKITVVDADNFDLDAAVWQTTGDASGTATPRGGSSKADAWLTLTSGATAARIQPGDFHRIKSATDETLVGEATWNQYSKIVTLAGAVTANIADCETAWTGSANVTQTADTSVFKEGSKSAKSVIAAGFTTGLISYFATGTLDLSAYQQVSFWVRSSAAIAASTLSLRLCSDAAGVTTVHTIAIPANPGANTFRPVTVDLGANMNSAIASVALYADLDPGTATVYLDNIIACKASSSADALSLTSLIGKVWNLVWVASTTYAANDIRKPTQPNRNGYRYKVTAGGGGAAGSSEPTWPQVVGGTVTDGALTWTCEGLEDSWYGIQSINGTTVKLDNGTNTLGNAGRGYNGATETVATYKRQPIAIAIQSNTSTSTMQVKDSGIAGSPITFSGGWDRTSMTVQNGETWVDGQNGWNTGISSYVSGASYINVENMNSTRCYYGTYFYNWKLSNFKNCHHNNSTYAGAIYSGVCQLNTIQGFLGLNCSGDGQTVASNALATSGLSRRIALSGNLAGGFSSLGSNPDFLDIVAANNGGYGIGNDTSSARTFKIANLTTTNNASGGVSSTVSEVLLINASIGESLEFDSMFSFYNIYIYSQKHDQIADNHLITTDGGTIVSATDRRHSASGISWKFRPTSTNRSSLYPLKLSVLKFAVAANVAVNVTIWTSRDNANIKGQLCILGGQIAGVPVDVMVACEPTVDAGFHISDALTFTPTEAGVVEICFKVWDGVNTTNNFWVDDLTVA